jgi:hypothetical protein
MTKKDVKVGATYLMNHTSGKVPVRILRVKPTTLYGGRSGNRDMTHWVALNTKTGREIEIKSAAKLLREIQTV